MQKKRFQLILLKFNSDTGLLNCTIQSTSISNLHCFRRKGTLNIGWSGNEANTWVATSMPFWFTPMTTLPNSNYHSTSPKMEKKNTWKAIWPRSSPSFHFEFTKLLKILEIVIFRSFKHVAKWERDCQKSNSMKLPLNVLLYFKWRTINIIYNLNRIICVRFDDIWWFITHQQHNTSNS